MLIITLWLQYTNVEGENKGTSAPEQPNEV